MDENDQLYGFCEQKRFRIKEDIRLYDDESKNNEWLVIKQRNLVDAWGGFDIFDPKAGVLLGTVRRKFWKSRWHTSCYRFFSNRGNGWEFYEYKY